MKDLRCLVQQVQAGDMNAFGAVVGRFQDMAFGYAYSILGDFGLAEDAAQEAFVQAYRNLAKLREPQAFPGWLRRLVFTQCHRIMRRKRVSTVPLEEAIMIQSEMPNPVQAAEKREMREQVLATIRALPEKERTVTTLFYINGYSMAEVGEFIEAPVSTVKNLLHSARIKMKGRMMKMVTEILKEKAPEPDQFSQRIMFRWKIQLADHLYCYPLWLGNSLLAADDNRVLFLSRTNRKGNVQSETVGIDAITGAVKWRVPCNDFAIQGAMKDKTLYIGGVDGNFFAFDSMTGDELWRCETEARALSVATIDRNNVYFCTEKHLWAVSRADGTPRWKVQCHLSVDQTSIALANTSITVVHQDKIIHTHAVDSGELLWKYVPDNQNPPLLLASRNTIYAASDGYLYALDRVTGELKWRKQSHHDYRYAFLLDRNNQKPYFNIEGNRFAAFSEDSDEIEEVLDLPRKGRGEIVDDRIYLTEEHLCCIIDKQNKSVIWQFAADSYLLLSPCVVNGKMYVASKGGMIYAFPGVIGFKAGKHDHAAKELMHNALEYDKAKQHAKAASLYEEIIDKVEPGNAQAWFNLALNQEKSGDNKKAISAWNKCLDFSGDDKEQIHIARKRLSKLDGSLWTNKTGIFSEAIHIEGDVLYLFGNGKVHLVNSTTGDILDVHEIGGQFLLNGARPLFTDDLILVPISSKGVCALEKDDFTTRWKLKTGGGPCNVSEHEDAAYITCWASAEDSQVGGGITKVDIGTGVVQWHSSIGHVGCAPTIIENTVYIGSEDGIYALDTGNGLIKWVTKDPPTNLSWQSTIVEHKGILYLSGGYSDKGVYALDRESGEIIWKRDVGAKPSTHALFHDNTVYSATRDALYALDSVTGAVKWRCDKVNVVGHMSYIKSHGGLLIARSFDYNGQIDVVSSEDGKLRNTLLFSRNRVWDYCIQDKVLYILMEGQIKAMPLSAVITRPASTLPEWADH